MEVVDIAPITNVKASATVNNIDSEKDAVLEFYAFWNGPPATDIVSTEWTFRQ